jgi:hypothetical protein
MLYTPSPLVLSPNEYKRCSQAERKFPKVQRSFEEVERSFLGSGRAFPKVGRRSGEVERRFNKDVGELYAAERDSDEADGSKMTAMTGVAVPF